MLNRTRILEAALMLFTLSVYTSSAWGAGFGPNVKWAHHSSSDLTDVTRANSEVGGFALKANLWGFGLAYDTNVARNDLVNYRVELDLEIGSFGSRGCFTDDGPLVCLSNQDAIGFGLNQTLGFGIFRYENLRIWIGPALRIGLHEVSDDVDGLEVDVGLGFELGLNIHTSDRFSVSPTVGYQYMLQYIELSGGMNSVDRDAGFIGGAHRVTLGVAFLFRTASDVFK